MSVELMMSSNHLIFCHPLLFLPSIFPSIRIFSNELALCMSRPKYWSFSFSISPSNEYSGLISFRIDWLDLLPIQGTLKSLLQHHSLKASILQFSALFMVQLSHLYMTNCWEQALLWTSINVTLCQLLSFCEVISQFWVISSHACDDTHWGPLQIYVLFSVCSSLTSSPDLRILSIINPTFSALPLQFKETLACCLGFTVCTIVWKLSQDCKIGQEQGFLVCLPTLRPAAFVAGCLCLEKLLFQLLHLFYDCFRSKLNPVPVISSLLWTDVSSFSSKFKCRNHR